MKLKILLSLVIFYSFVHGQDIIETGISDTSNSTVAPLPPTIFSPRSPCDDSLFKVLSAKELLTQAEVYYKTHKENECMAYSDSLKQAIQDSISKPEKEARWQKRKEAIITGIIAGAIAEIVLIVLIFNNAGSIYADD